MEYQQAKKLIKETFEEKFNESKFSKFIANLLNEYERSEFQYHGAYLPKAFKEYIDQYKRVGKYSDGDNRIDILIVNLNKSTSIERARTMQRNFIAGYLKGNYGSDTTKDAALVAFVSPEEEDWRFSIVTLDYQFVQDEDKLKVAEKLTPAKRLSFLVGKNENSHTAQKQLIDILLEDEKNPSLNLLKEKFNIETVSDEFFEKYRDLFIRTKESLDKVVNHDKEIKDNFEEHNINTVQFAKKLLGQIVFLYFLQKKGWFGVDKDKQWGMGSKNFLRELYNEKHKSYDNFFNDILEPLFYEALRTDRRHDDSYYSNFDCKIPFLNGGLFDPINNYDWVSTEILLPNELFSNDVVTDEGDKGDGILDVFDRYNFTVKEDEPLDKEVAIDPELLGKAYEKFNAIRPDNFAEYKRALKSNRSGAENRFNKKYGVYYTPRPVVHYICQQSLINYLENKLNDLADKESIKTLVLYGEQFAENDSVVIENERETKDYSFQMDESIRENAEIIDNKLKSAIICDPAVGSGAFPVGMMHEIVKIRKVLSIYTDGYTCNPYQFKRETIEKSIYGVDIDPGAVEIAKLRLWLSLVVDEDDFHNIKPLPNLLYKIACGDSLLGYPFRPNTLDEIEKMKNQYFNVTNPSKKLELEKAINKKINNVYKNAESQLGYKVNFDFKIHFSEVFHHNDGIDIVVGNPPYVSTKGVSQTSKSDLKKVYGFSDDLYSHFFFRSMDILRDKGILSFITSSTFFTIITKQNLRRELQKNKLIEINKTDNVFEAMVSPAITIIQKYTNTDNYSLVFKDSREDFDNPKEYKTDINKYRKSINSVIFPPDKFNNDFYNKYNSKVRSLHDRWWDKIRTSRKISSNKVRLEQYRKSLKPGDITLLGLVTEGGQGLATGDNGRFVGLKAGTDIAKRYKSKRPERLLRAINNENISELNINNKEEAKNYLNGIGEVEIRKLFDNLKEQYGRDIFAQGYLYKIIDNDEVAIVENLTEKEKQDGIKNNIRHFVPYDKGDKKGNRWYLETPYLLDWSYEAVKKLKSSPKARWQGYKFYFKEGFCWTDVNSTYLKCRIKEKGVHDVLSMSLFSLVEQIPEFYIISLINSSFISEYVDFFVNSTSHFQINDARQVPIIVPTDQQLSNFKDIFNRAVAIKKDQFSDNISDDEAKVQLDLIQDELDELVYDLYDMDPDLKEY